MISQYVASGDNIKIIKSDELSWIDIERPSKEDIYGLRDVFPFHELDLEDCLSRVQLPKIDEYPDYLFMVLHFPLFNKKTKLTVSSQLCVFVGSDYLVTVHSGNLRPLVRLFNECEKNAELFSKMMAERSSGMLMYRILDVLVDYCFPIVYKLNAMIDSLEEQIFDSRDKTVVRNLSLLRRDILAYRRITRPQIGLFEILEKNQFTVLGNVNTGVYFGDLADHMRRLWADLEDLKEVIEGLHDTHASLISNNTTETMRVLTIIATIVLPLTVVSGLYGMNVEPLPFKDTGAGFWVVLGTMGFIASAMVIFFKIRRWL